MLTRTFCHIPGIGPGREKKIWEAGLTSWNDVITQPSPPPGISRRIYETLRTHCCEASDALEHGDVGYFTRLLPAREHWRIFPLFRDRCVFLDIETTGASVGEDSVTTVALYDGHDTHCLVRDHSLHTLASLLERYQIVVTYNGKSFDVPCIQNNLGIHMPHAHIDLCHVCHSLGIKGGLKKTEQALGITRPGLDGLDGYAAVILWQMYRRHRDERLLHTLLAYNCADAVNLEPLMITAYNLKLRDIPFPPSPLNLPTSPPLPYMPDPEIVEAVREYMSSPFTV